jgi:GT2 family glycosyltransferase
MQRKGILAGTLQPELHVVVSMGDAEIADLAGGEPDCTVVDIALADGKLPLAAARNIGAASAIAHGAEVLIFLDVDCVPGPELVHRYHDSCQDLANQALYCGTVCYLPPAGPAGYDLNRLPELATPHPARPTPAEDEVLQGDDWRLFWSLSFALSAAAWHTIGGFCERYVGYGAEDTDFGQQADAAGVALRWVGGAQAYHQHHATSTPPVQHLDDILRNGRLFRYRWGWWPMQGWLRDFEAAGLISYLAETDEWQST